MNQIWLTLWLQKRYRNLLCFLNGELYIKSQGYSNESNMTHIVTSKKIRDYSVGQGGEGLGCQLNTADQSGQYNYIVPARFCPQWLISFVQLAQNRLPYLPSPPSHSIYKIITLWIGSSDMGLFKMIFSSINAWFCELSLTF